MYPSFFSVVIVDHSFLISSYSALSSSLCVTNIYQAPTIVPSKRTLAATTVGGQHVVTLKVESIVPRPSRDVRSLLTAQMNRLKASTSEDIKA